MTPDFPNFLKRILKDPNQACADGGPSFVHFPEGGPVTDEEIAESERELGVRFPESYREFVQKCGSGFWCGDPVLRPGELYRFDDLGEMSGFIAIAKVLGGDYLAINPDDIEVEGELPVYFCGHDPLGHGKFAESFEEWARGRIASCEFDFYERRQYGFRELPSIRRASSGAKKWWQFWL